MQGSNKDSITCVTEGELIKHLGFKCRKWVAVTAGVAIDQEYLCGIIIHTAGTLTLIDADGTEIDCGTPSGNPIAVLPICPASVKIGCTAVVYAIYEG